MKRILSLLAIITLICGCGVDAHCPCIVNSVQSSITGSRDTTYVVDFKTILGFNLEIATINKYNIGDTIK